MKLYGFVILLFTATIAGAQSVSTLVGARPAGMGYACSTLKDEWALFNNPGAIAEVNKASSIFTYDINPSLPGANRMAAGILLPAKFGVTGFGAFRFGDELYSEQIVSGAFSNKFGIASLGVKVNYIQYKAQGTGTKSAASVSFGGLTQITSQISVGAYIININQATISETEQLPTKLTAGLGFKPNDTFLISTEIEKDINYDATWRLGAEYTILKKIFARTGFNLNPASVFFGAGFRSGSLILDYSISNNRILGTTYQASAGFQFGKIVKK